MPLYTNVIFPRIYDFLMGLGGLEEARGSSLAHVRGKILEIGIGTGLNLPHYPQEVERLTAIDPNPGMLRELARRTASSRLTVESSLASAEELPSGDDSFDTVVCTHVLCSIPDRARALREIRRVLRPGGRFVFLEHGLSPDRSVARWQRRLNGIQKRFAVGCLLDVPVKDEIAAAGFDFEHLDEHYLEGRPRIHSYIYDGVATPVSPP